MKVVSIFLSSSWQKKGVFQKVKLLFLPLHVVDILSSTEKVSEDGIFLKSTHYFVQTDSGL